MIGIVRGVRNSLRQWLNRTDDGATEDPERTITLDPSRGDEERQLLERLPQFPGGVKLRRRVATALASPAKMSHGAAERTCLALNRLAAQLLTEGQKAPAIGALSLAFRVGLVALGEAHLDTLANRSSLAVCLQDLGRSGEALPHFEAALAGFRQTLGEAHPYTLASRNNLAACLRELGRSREALPHFEATLLGRRQTLGEVHRDTLASRRNLAACLQNLGRLEEALPHAEAALEACEQVFGNRHLDTLVSRNNLAACLQDLGRNDEALPYFEATLTARRQMLGEAHRATLASRRNLAACLQDLGRSGEAMPHFEAALAGLRQALGETHPDTLATRDKLAICLQDLGRADEALPHFEAVLSARHGFLGETHPQTIESLQNLAGCLLTLGRYGEALPHARAAIKESRQAVGEEHPNTIGIIGTLAWCLLALGQIDEALQYFQTALAASRRGLPEAHPRTLVCLNNLGACLVTLGRGRDALPQFEEALATSRRVLGEEHPQTLRCLGNLALCLLRLRRFDEALGHLEAALATSRRVLGEEHPQTLRCLNNLALCLPHLGPFDEALEHLEAALATSRRVLGEEHPQTLQTLNNLALCLESLGRSEEAAERWRAMSLALCGLPQPGGDWLELLAHTVGSVAEHARTGRLADWPELFAGLRETLAETMDLLDAEQWAVARAGVAAFHGTYLALCLDLGRSDLVPAALAGVQGRRLAALVLEELDRRAEGADPKSLPARYRKVRLELRRLALGLQVVSGSQLESPGAPQRSAEAEATLQRARVETYTANLAEYRKLRAEIAAADPAQVGGAPSFAPTLAELQAGLGPEAAMVLLLMRQDPAAAGTVVALMIRPEGPQTVSLGQWAPTAGPAADATENRSGTWRGRHGRRFTAREGLCQASEQTEPADADSAELPLRPAAEESWEDWLQARLWDPLAKHLQDVRTLHLVTQGVLHALPIEAGSPPGIKVATYPGLVYYHRLQQAGPLPPPRPAGRLAIRAYGAEDTSCPIPLVRVEPALLRALWPGPEVIDGHAPEDPAVGGLHLAGHGEFDPRDPTQARVWLGPGETLGFHEVLARQRVPAVVFLSACVVGRTSEDPVDGDPLGLVGALFLRGARYVIGPLQPVGDLVMPILVALFYQAWCGAGLAPAGALAEARVRLASGDWYPDTEGIVRAAYPPVVDAWAARMAREGDDPSLLLLAWDWFPDLLTETTRERLAERLEEEEEKQAAAGRQPSAMAVCRAVAREAGVCEELRALRVVLDDPASRNTQVAGLVEWLVRERKQPAVADLVTWVRGFGLGDAPGD